MKIFGWMHGNILADQIKKKNRQDNLKQDKIRETRLRWFGTKEARRGNSEQNCLEIVETLSQRDRPKKIWINI